MGVTYSSAGEYGNAIDVLVPTEFDAIRGARGSLIPATPGGIRNAGELIDTPMTTGAEGSRSALLNFSN